eukprot:GFKZ01012294.1.p1 GENE.GFKZ01012294.1~~GFKZ01012294.1.p1  ORF type:complete len:121 (+),score=13.86 GFKZ01012294.1:104-466(+)
MTDPSLPPVPTPQAIPPPTSPSAAQGRAARMLIASLINEPELADIKSHQTCTLHELQQVKQALQALNALSAEEYALHASELTKATRLAGQVQANLNDISKRLSNLKRMLGTLRIPGASSE